MRIAFSWDDGAPEDQRLFELHERYELPGMFFVPTVNREGRAVLTPQQLRQAESRYVAFGGHTRNHTYLAQMPIEQVPDEVNDNRKYLEDTLGHEIPDFCLPGGSYNEEVLRIVYRYFKTIRTADTMCFRYNGGPLKPALHFYPRGLRSLLGNAYRHHSYRQLLYVATHASKDYFTLLRGLIAAEKDREDSTVMIWGHSWELEQFGLWGELEHLMQELKTNGVNRYADLFER